MSINMDNTLYTQYLFHKFGY